jgi:hypothetical protein
VEDRAMTQSHIKNVKSSEQPEVNHDENQQAKERCFTLPEGRLLV